MTEQAAETTAPAAGAPARAPRKTARKSTTRKTAARKSTARKTAAKRTGARKTARAASGDGRRRTARSSGALASSLSSLLDNLDSELTAIRDLSRQIDEHVTTLNRLRADQQARVAALVDLRAVAKQSTLGNYLDERLGELQPPTVAEEDFPWARRR